MPGEARQPICRRKDHVVANNTASVDSRHMPVMSQGLRRLLALVFLLVALLVVNSTYLAAITLLEHFSDESHQGFFYLSMFLLHLALGLTLIVPFLVFGVLHLRRAMHRANRYAIRAGAALFVTGSLVLLSGILLTRFGFFEVNEPGLRRAAYWLHVVAPFVAVWLFVLHRLAGHRVRWSQGLRWGAAAAGFAACMVGWNLLAVPTAGPGAEAAFATTLIRTPGGERLAAAAFMTDDFCAECHADVAAGWRMSSHRLSSFNNPFYSFSAQETRKVSMDTTGTVEKAQLCAGCHDIVPLVSGHFDDPGFDIVSDPTAHAGLGCTSCHAITAVNSVLGNADFTLSEPVRYPFEHSDNAFLKAVNRQLIKAKPSYHKKGFLKPVHSSPEFCGSCHKVHLPEAVNDYKWLRGQDHYDSFMQSGVSGHRVDSFYYPPHATSTCAACHMPLEASDDPAARDFDGSGTRKIHSHFFPAANTGLAHALGLPDSAIAAHRRMLEGAARIDIFGVREAGEIDGVLHAPLDRSDPMLQPGRRYLVETVLRNLRVGHHLTQGTADSNELWVDISVSAGGRLIGRSGAVGPDGTVDPWSFFVNAYVLTREGERLDRRNGQDTFVALYDHQIAPGAAAVVHYLLEVPAEVNGPVTIEAALRYRKFDTTYLRYVQGERFRRNDLPIVTLASDRVSLPSRVGDARPAVRGDDGPEPWERWNDYGIGLLLAGEARQTTLRQAEHAFRRVEALGRPDGPLNLARVYLKEGRTDDAAAALQRAAERHPGFRPWTRAWLTALVDREHGHLDRAVTTLKALLDTRFAEARERGFDFAKDFRARNLLGRTLYEQARRERGAARAQRRRALLEEARSEFAEVLILDPENLAAHFNLALIYAELGDAELAEEHRVLVDKYRPDDHAVERAVTMHRRRNPAADHAAEPVAVYDLQRPRADGLDAPTRDLGSEDVATEIAGVNNAPGT
jgi:tetratricopeptide (TPR) repeat protein